MKSRPYLYHLTDRVNLRQIERTHEMSPAVLLMERAGRLDLVRIRRRRHERIAIGGITILLRDQAPLHKGSMELQGDCIYEDVIEDINARVFFWPGTTGGPISYGVRHFERYRSERPVILRVNFHSLLKSNPNVEPKFCRYNSGSPRCSNGMKSPRGPDTFAPAAEFVGTPSNVVEVTFESPIVVPADTTIGEYPNGPWQPLSACDLD